MPQKKIPDSQPWNFRAIFAAKASSFARHGSQKCHFIGRLQRGHDRPGGAATMGEGEGVGGGAATGARRRGAGVRFAMGLGRGLRRRAARGR